MQADNGKPPEGRDGREPSYHELREENARLHRQLTEMEQERDAYLDALKKYIPAEVFDLSAKALLACADKGMPLTEIVAELKKDPEYAKQRS